jgi:hypothetical protein
VTVVFPAGELESQPFDLAGGQPVGWTADENWSPCKVKLQLADGDAWRDLHLAGKLVSIDVQPNRAELGLSLPLADGFCRLVRPNKDIERRLNLFLV